MSAVNRSRRTVAASSTVTSRHMQPNGRAVVVAVVASRMGVAHMGTDCGPQFRR